jgi:hypothetical protein
MANGPFSAIIYVLECQIGNITNLDLDGITKHFEWTSLNFQDLDFFEILLSVSQILINLELHGNSKKSALLLNFRPIKILPSWLRIDSM